jgi:tetratricopeptide (TPR) repeat protein
MSLLMTRRLRCARGQSSEHRVRSSHTAPAAWESRPVPSAADARATGADALDAANAMTHRTALKRAIDLIEPHMWLAGQSPSAGGRREVDLREGIHFVDAALRIIPKSWAAWWVRGKALQALGDHEAACDSLRRAHDINGNDLDVSRELVTECLETGRSTEAVRLAEAMSCREPQNAGLLANLALAYLMDGRLDEASRAADAASKFDVTDSVIALVRRRIDDVRTGRWPQPSRLSDLSRRA